MDGELWAARMSNSKRHHNLQPSHSAHLDQHVNLDDVDGDEDVRPDFSCPYCYEDFDITSLCAHLEDEHCFESKPAICPVCAAKIGTDMSEMPSHENLREERRRNFHFINVECVALTAAYMQRRRRFRRGGTPSSATLSLLGRELREAHLQALFGGGTSRIGSLGTTATDPLLTNLDYSLPISEAEDPPKLSVTIDTPSKPLTSIHQPSPSADALLTAEEREQQSKDVALRVKFMQQLVLSTIFGDS
ncbi:unnamed protein product [Sphagnum troendelagicum]|uniref:Uncharacterized protein n=1 Tax=Sphagnum troendelagicum TaxID=128251 RepID=A0ABP0T9Y5_9BRYO